MTILIVLAAIAAVIGACFFAFGVSRLVRRRVVIHTVDEESLRGRLVSATIDGFTLEAAELLAGGDVAIIQGRVFVPRRNVSWIQRLTEASE